MKDQTIVRIGGVSLLIVLLIAAIFSFTMSMSNASRENLDGEWSGKTNDDFGFVAEVEDDILTVYVDLGGTKGLYWKGDFIFDSVEDGDKINSIADQDALQSSLLGSLLEEKDFKYENGEIVFDYGIMGTTREVRLVEQ